MTLESQETSLRSRIVGGTEYSWCRAVPAGTGISVAAIISTEPPDVENLQDALRKIQDSHAILRCRIRYDVTENTFSFVLSPHPYVEFQSVDLASTSALIHPANLSERPFHAVVEHELGKDTWGTPDGTSYEESNVVIANVYALPGKRWVTAIRFHTAACDRTTAVTVLRELIWLLKDTTTTLPTPSTEIGPPVEVLIPKNKRDKPLWARGIDMICHSLGSLRLTNFPFDDTKSPRVSAIVRMRVDAVDAERIITGCRTRGIKLCGALSAAGMMAVQSLSAAKMTTVHYSVVTLVDCRPMLDPPLTDHDLGFYQSAIVNVHAVGGGEDLWELAKRCFAAFEDSKKRNKHFSDLADLNFLMCKAIENPGLTPSSSSRTSFMSVFEETLTDDDCSDVYPDLGVEDYVGCSSVHGVGPSIAMFDSMRTGSLDCACVYPSPLYSKGRMEVFMAEMKRLLVEAANAKPVQHDSVR